MGVGFTKVSVEVILRHKRGGLVRPPGTTKAPFIA